MTTPISNLPLPTQQQSIGQDSAAIAKKLTE